MIREIRKGQICIDSNLQPMIVVGTIEFLGDEFVDLRGFADNTDVERIKIEVFKEEWECIGSIGSPN